jgi:hypothetical protein
MSGLLNLLFPQRIDNDFRGQRLALWLFGLLVLMWGVIGVNSILHGAQVAGSADGIPLETFGPAGARTVILLFALLGLGRLVMCLWCALVLVRYRALVPLMFGLFLLEQSGGKLIHRYLPVPHSGHAPGGIVTLVLYGLTILGFGLSLWRRGGAASGSGAPGT